MSKPAAVALLSIVAVVVLWFDGSLFASPDSALLTLIRWLVLPGLLLPIWLQSLQVKKPGVSAEKIVFASLRAAIVGLFCTLFGCIVVPVLFVLFGMSFSDMLKLAL
ncbi:hypothetical protein HK096_008633 [Nowakowskiella sp. JEL0078]|nr:hypothetical protein HK096_008633 [Nowakowskiella sp. JEL0078]